MNKLDGTGGYAAAIHDDNRATVINGAHSLIKMTIKSAGKIVYDTSNLHKVIFVKNLLQYSDDFSRSVAKNSFWYLDSIDYTVITDGNGDELGYKTRRRLTAADSDVNVIIPLNRYGFFEELNDRLLVTMQLQFEINLQNDREFIHKLAGADDGRVVINRFYLWVPKMVPTDSMYDEFRKSFLTEKYWTYKRELYQVSGERQSSGYFQISASIDNVESVYVSYNEPKWIIQMRIHTYSTLSSLTRLIMLAISQHVDWNMVVKYFAQKLNTIQNQK